MIGKALVLAGGLAGAGAVSQFPEFSQQYVQRLGGAVDALAGVVADFDVSAAAVGLTREEALAEMRGTDFVERRRADMAATIARHDRLAADLAALRSATPWGRAAEPLRFSDNEIMAATWADFRPAVPISRDGLTFAALGLLLGMVLAHGLLTLLRMPFRALRVA